MELFIHELTNRTMPFIFDYECYDMLPSFTEPEKVYF